jgi:hypothetical protein
VSIHFSGTTDEPEMPASMRTRILCHLLLSQIPDRGLSEALESLYEMWQFYRTTPAQIPAPSKPPSLPAKLGKTYVRPEFHVSED